MKKKLIIPAIIGLLAVPSMAMAHRGPDDTTTAEGGPSDNTSSDIRHDDRRMGTTPTAVPTSNTSNRTDDDSIDHSQNVVVPADSITIDQAKTIALGVFPDQTIKKVETEHEHGTLVFSVRFTNDSRVDVRASDGAVIRTESETQDDDNSDRRGSGRHENMDDRSGSDSIDD